MTKSVLLQTYGCQMNERDSEEALGMLTAQGYRMAASPEEADVILFNTCSVRQHAEERAIGKMGEFQLLKKERPELVLGIIGCMAKLRQEALFKQLPSLDLIAGPAELYDLPYLLAEISEKRRQHGTIFRTRVASVGRPFRPLDQKPMGDFRHVGVSAFVTIMEGCDKSCAYCIVPKTRGQEISRPAEEILREVRQCVEAGYQEVTLLGQNVNSYGKRFPDGSGYKGPLGRLRLLEDDPDALLDFPQLLRLIDRRTLIRRVRFTTSHPIDATERLFCALRDCESACEYVHLPAQSGSNRILRAMRRGYTAEAYLEKVALLRRYVPEISLSTDIIVGFPGETEDDFQATVRLMREVGFDNAYLFKYSPRPGTDAAAREDTVPDEVKTERHQALLALQQGIEQVRHQRFEGQQVEVLIERRAKEPDQWFGRTRGNQSVVLRASEDFTGQFVEATVTRAVSHTLFAEPVGSPIGQEDACRA